MDDSSFKVGITKTFPCSYLPDEEECLLIAIDERLQNKESYSLLMMEGFRRSGEQSYKPHCPTCNACQSLRVLIEDFTPSKSQKRSLKRNANFIIKHSDHIKANYYPLYENYINTFHQDGSMYPASVQQFESFITSKLTTQLFIETWSIVDGKEQLICVGVTDVLTNGLSAVYTFYHPDFKSAGLGRFSILTQIDLCRQMQLPYLYLGYQIDDCKKMNYKNSYYPHERFINQEWNLFKRKCIKD